MNDTYIVTMVVIDDILKAYGVEDDWLSGDFRGAYHMWVYYGENGLETVLYLAPTPEMSKDPDDCRAKSVHLPGASCL